MASDPPYSSKAIKEIRDVALMLSLGNAYLCEEPFLKKIGLTLDRHLEELKSDISSLKKKFPGRPVKEVDTDQVLRGIQNTAKRLQKPDNAVSEKCSVGELGQELQARINSLVSAVDELRVQVEGEAQVYTMTDSIMGHVARIKSVVNQIANISTFMIRSIALLILACILPLTYLIVTMESQKDLLNEIDQIKIHIQSQREAILKLDDEKKELSQEIESIRTTRDELSRQQKVQIIDLDMEIYQLSEDARKAEIEIALHERKIKESVRRIAMLENKSFLERLFRQ